MSWHIVCPDHATWLAVAHEIGATPDIEGGVGPVWLAFDPDGPPEVNVVTPAVGADGRRMAAHHGTDVDRAWLAAYLADRPGVLVLDAPPADWAWPEGEP